MNALESVQHYIKHTALPHKLGRVIYNTHNKAVISAIKRAGLTPIPLAAYRRMQASQDSRPYITWEYKTGEQHSD